MAGSPSKRPEGYEDLLQDLKERVRVARVRAALAVNREFLEAKGSARANFETTLAASQSAEIIAEPVEVLG